MGVLVKIERHNILLETVKGRNRASIYVQYNVTFLYPYKDKRKLFNRDFVNRKDMEGNKDLFLLFFKEEGLQ